MYTDERVTSMKMILYTSCLTREQERYLHVFKFNLICAYTKGPYQKPRYGRMESVYPKERKRERRREISKFFQLNHKI